MKKIIRIITIIVCIGLLIGIGFVMSRKIKKYPDKIEFCESTFVTDKGMYYSKQNRIYFLDAKTGEAVIVCNKANCKHNTQECNAYTYDSSPKFLCYDDKIYVAEVASKIQLNDDDEYSYEAMVQIRELKKDGSGARVLYSADEGSVGEMQMIDGVLYFTAWKYHDGFKVNEYHMDWTLNAYDLRWNQMRVLKKLDADASHDNAILNIVNSIRKDKIYMQYTYVDDNESEHNEFTTYDIKNKRYELVKKLDESTAILKVTDKLYWKKMQDEDEKSWIVLYTSDLNFDNAQETLRMQDEDERILDEYIFFCCTDYEKFLYRLDTGEIYLANTCFTEKGTYVPDLYAIDEENNRIYIDGHDYTGMKEGEIYYEDLSDYRVVDWTEFRDTYFTKLEDADQNTVAAFGWVKWPEE